MLVPSLSPRAKALALALVPGLAAAAVLAYSPSARAQGYYQGGGYYPGGGGYYRVCRTTYEYFYDDRRNTTGLELGADLEGAVPINIKNVNGNDVRGGGGFKLRVGETFRLRDLRVTPEIGYGFTHLFANDDENDPAYDWNLHRAFAGVRFGFGRFLVPVVYGHVGYGWRATSDPLIPQASGFAYDAGVALDLHLIPHFGFGAHAEVAGIDSQPYTPQWIALGLHAELVF